MSLGLSIVPDATVRFDRVEIAAEVEYSFYDFLFDSCLTLLVFVEFDFLIREDVFGGSWNVWVILVCIIGGLVGFVEFLVGFSDYFDRCLKRFCCVDQHLHFVCLSLTRREFWF